MPIFDLFSKKQKRERGEVADVFVYDQLPNQLRVQIIHIIRDAIGKDHYGTDYAKQTYQTLNDILCREYGVFELTQGSNSHAQRVFEFFLRCDHEQALDVVQVSFRAIDRVTRSYGYQQNTTRKMGVDDAILELNGRFKEHGIGYQFESGELIRLDSQFLHSEAVKPTLALLREKAFRGANEEFLRAHEHYRHSRCKECLNEALKSFESVMKSICAKHNWQYNRQIRPIHLLISACAMVLYQIIFSPSSQRFVQY
jgi:hypothetical protein